jgi:multidrug transporter EmrE-like cation transporter
MNTIFYSYILIVLAGLLTAAGNICLKLSRRGDVSLDIMQGLLNPYFILGISFYAVNVLIFSKSLDKLEITVAYPLLTAVGYLALFIISFLYMGETLSYVKILGAIFVLVGISLLVSS